MSIIILILLLCSINLSAQESSIYIAPDLKKIYDGNTRSWDGRPGEGYWQNSADYFLRAEFKPMSKEIYGEGRIVYKNNSPDSIKDLVLYLYSNIFKEGVSSAYNRRPEHMNKGVEITSMKINGTDFRWKEKSRGSGTIMYIDSLPGVLPPGEELLLEISWNYQVIDKFQIRTGIYQNKSIFAAYWFPRIGVYDDVEGWDINEYTGPAEFYNDFGSFDVEITVPGNYLLWATGKLQNPEDIYIPEILKKYLSARNSEEVVNIISSEDYKRFSTLTKNAVNTWKFSAGKVSDFSFALAENYIWDGSILRFNDRNIFVDAVYPEEAPHYDEAVYYSKKVIEFGSTELPGVAFPFDEFTTFCNGRRTYGGMETPMMANNNAPEEKPLFITLLAHEIWHSYFPFYVGTNEKKYTWMDEGWMSYFPDYLFPENDSTFNYIPERKQRQMLSSHEYDVPPMVISSSLSWQPLAAYSYIRSLFAYDALMELLGKDLFKKALREYMEQWALKHPTPYDFFFTFNRIAGEDLDWFWKPWFFEFGHTDLAIRKGEAENSAEIVNMGNHPVPLKVRLTYTDGSEDIIIENPKIWKDKSVFELRPSSGKKIKSAEILTDRINDIDETNNIIETF
jgi:hypothetical protein